MLWELWSRRKWVAAAQVVLLLLAVIVVQRAPHFSGADRDVLIPIAFQAGLVAILQILACFCYVEVDSRRLQGGIPGHLFLKPITTLRMVAVPMVCGGVIVVGVFLAWAVLVWRPLFLPAAELPWICALVLSFTWCVQAVAWSSANLSWGAQMLLVLLTAAAHLFVGLIPNLPLSVPHTWRLGMIAAMAGCGLCLAQVGVARIRQGSWEGGQRKDCAQLRPLARRKPRRFQSPFAAQFWVEWQRQGLKLPLISGIGILFLILIDVGVRRAFSRTLPGAATGDEPFTPVLLSYVMVIPILCSLVMGEMLARFDLGEPGNELPVFMAVRPMANGGFVLAKLAMAAATSLLTWIVAIGLVLVWLLEAWNTRFLTRLSTLAGATPTGLAVPLLGFFLLVVMLTWRNLVAGIWVGLTARPLLIGVAAYLRGLLYVGLFLLGTQANDAPGLRGTLLRWLPWGLGAALGLKLLVSGAAFLWCLRRKTITPGAAAWIAGGWLACGFCVAGLAHYVCASIHAPGAWFEAALAGFYLLPLAQLAAAPMALAWNRHR
jgi:hypothetical protein